MEVGGRDTKVECDRVVPASLVKDVARLVLMSRGTYERATLASDQRSRCGICQKQCPAPASETKSIVPIAGHLPDEYFVLWGCRKPAKDDTPPSQSTSAGDDEDDEYTQVCISAAFACKVDAFNYNPRCR